MAARIPRDRYIALMRYITTAWGGTFALMAPVVLVVLCGQAAGRFGAGGSWLVIARLFSGRYGRCAAMP